MGLALHNSGSLPDPIFSTARHFPVSSPRARRYRGRDRHQAAAALLRAVLDRPVVTGDNTTPSSAVTLARRRQASGPSIPRRRPPRHGPFIEESDDDIRLARSSCPLPTDGSRDRVPSLERQNAFRDPSTARPPQPRSLSQGCEDEDPEVAELYRLGLLYDDEHVRGSGFDLNTIVRDEPSYTLEVRPPRRQRRSPARARAAEMKLPTDWTFPVLEEDDEVARYLVSPADGTTPARRGYRMIWRSAAAPGPEQHQQPLASPDLFSDTASFYSLHQSTHSDFPPQEFDRDDDDDGWAVLSRHPRDADAAPSRTEDAATGPWVVLGDGS